MKTFTALVLALTITSATAAPAPLPVLAASPTTNAAAGTPLPAASSTQHTTPPAKPGQPTTKPSASPAPATAAGKPATPVAQPPAPAVHPTWFSAIQSALTRTSRTAWCCGAALLVLTYILVYRIYAVRALIRKIRAEERLAISGISGDVPLHHPALVAIRKWTQSPASPVDRAYRWVDQGISAVFGTLITQGEGLRTLSLNISFASTLLAFLLAMTAGRDLDKMLGEVAGALGATLFGLLLFSVESATLAKLSTEAVRLEFDGREMLDLWAASRPGPRQESQPQPAPSTTQETYANPS